MNLIMLKDFFSEYSAPSVIIAFIISIAKVIIDKSVGSKTVKHILAYSPFILGILFCYLYNVIFLGVYTFDISIIYAGILGGSLSCAFAVVLNKIIKGESLPTNTALALITGLIDGYVMEDKAEQVVENIYNLFVNTNTDEEQSIIVKITEILNDFSNGLLQPAELLALSAVILSSLKELSKD